MLPHIRLTHGLFIKRIVCNLGAYSKIPTLLSAHSSYSTVERNEVDKFSKQASTFWWSDVQLLQSFNSLRVPFVRDGLLAHAKHHSADAYPLKGVKIIDVGCGGGILSEPLARLGANVTGLDPGQENIEVAIAHASEDEQIKDKITYICDSMENISESHAGVFDAVVCSEVIEHVADVKTFLKCCVNITKEGGSLFFTTPNRSVVSYICNIVLGEYVLQLLPRGTHDYNKFITSEELSQMLCSLDCRIVSTEGIIYNAFTKKFNWSKKRLMYALHACK